MSGRQKLQSLVVIASLAVLAACSSGGNGSSTGSVSVSLIDRPIDGVTALFVTITAIYIKPNGDGPAEELPMTASPITVDLLSLTPDNAAILVDNAVVEARDYNWIEFEIDDSDITKAYATTMEGGDVPMQVDVPSNRIRLVSGFTVEPNQAVQFVFDWEVNRGLTHSVGRDLYILKPAFRVLRVDVLGSISGSLTASTAAGDSNCNADASSAGKVAYFFEGDVTPDDTDGSGVEPVTTADTQFDDMTGGYTYRALLLPGDYTVAFTCLGDTETDDGDEDLQFLTPLSGDTIYNVTTGAAVENVDF